MDQAEVKRGCRDGRHWIAAHRIAVVERRRRREVLNTPGVC